MNTKGKSIPITIGRQVMGDGVLFCKDCGWRLWKLKDGNFYYPHNGCEVNR